MGYLFGRLGLPGILNTFQDSEFSISVTEMASWSSPHEFDPFDSFDCPSLGPSWRHGRNTWTGGMKKVVDVDYIIMI